MIRIVGVLADTSGSIRFPQHRILEVHAYQVDSCRKPKDEQAFARRILSSYFMQSMARYHATELQQQLPDEGTSA